METAEIGVLEKIDFKLKATQKGKNNKNVKGGGWEGLSLRSIYSLETAERALFFAKNIEFKIYFLPTTRHVLNCDFLRGAQKPQLKIFLWFLAVVLKKKGFCFFLSWCCVLFFGVFVVVPCFLSSLVVLGLGVFRTTLNLIDA